jgi:hypothetical protein
LGVLWRVEVLELGLRKVPFVSHSHKHGLDAEKDVCGAADSSPGDRDGASCHRGTYIRFGRTKRHRKL